MGSLWDFIPAQTDHVKSFAERQVFSLRQTETIPINYAEECWMMHKENIQQQEKMNDILEHFW